MFTTLTYTYNYIPFMSLSDPFTEIPVHWTPNRVFEIYSLWLFQLPQSSSSSTTFLCLCCHPSSVLRYPNRSYIKNLNIQTCFFIFSVPYTQINQITGLFIIRDNYTILYKMYLALKKKCHRNWCLMKVIIRTSLKVLYFNFKYKKC